MKKEKSDPHLLENNKEEKCHIHETPTLLACVDSSTDTMKSRLVDPILHLWSLLGHFFVAFFATSCDTSGTF